MTDKAQISSLLQLTQFTMDRVADAIFWMGPDASFIYVNDAACQFLGYSRDELLKLSVFDIDPNFSTEIWPTTWENIKKAGSLNLESSLQARDGRVFPVEITANYIKFEGQEYNCAIVRDVTKRKQVEQELGLMQTAVEKSSTAIYRVSSDGRVLYVNDHACKSLGYSRDELIGRHVWEFDPDFPPEAWPSMWEGLRKTGVTYIESHHRRKDGTIFPIEVTGNYISANGEEYSFVFVQDTTERKRAESKLLESERVLLEAQKMAHIGNWFWNVKTGECEWSDEVYKIFRLDPNEFTPEINSIMELSPWPEDNERHREIVQKAIENHSPGTFEQKFLRPDGSTGVYFSTFQGIYDVHDELIAMRGTIQDITERKQAEEQLMLAHTTINMSKTAFYWLSPEGQVQYVNDFACQSLGYSREEMVGLYIWDFDPDFPAEAWPPAWTEIKEKGMYNLESRHRRKDGTIFPVEVTANYVISNGEEHNFVSVQDITERKEADESIQQLAYFDALTGLPNRTLLHDRLEQLLAWAARDDQEFSVLFLDLDRFKYVNDSMGHAVGDKLLQSVANRLKLCVREADTVSRIGGDEFIILLRDTDAVGAARVAHNMLKSIEVTYDIDGQQIFTHASIGISMYPANAADVEKLIKYADIAMYRAKEEGRNNFQFFAEEMNLRSDLLFSMEKDLRVALEQNEFSLHYQPQVSLINGKVCGAEALLRWKHPKKGFISPAEFIPVAEDTGQIIAIGEWVLRTACRQLAEWRKQGMAVFPLAVNLSIRQLRQPELALIIAGIIKDTGLQPCDLELEITEGIMMNYVQASIAFLKKMNKLGVQLSIDDFGTGFSSLSYLKQLPVNKLKIDQSFVRDIEVDESDDAIVRSIIGLGHQFQLKVIAEGVETAKQLDFLRLNGCDEIQGYYFSRPIPADEFVKFINGNPKLELTPPKRK